MTTPPFPESGSRSHPDPATVAGAVQEYPLNVSDPPKVGDFWLDSRLTATASGVGYLAHDDHHTPAMVLMLAQGAAEDAAARDRLAGEVNKMHADTVIARGGQGQDGGRLAGKFRGEDDDPVEPGHAPLAPWVALAYDGSPAAVAELNRLLTTVDLSSTPLLGTPAGPSYRLHWIEDAQPGTWRLWPLPWPGRHDRAGWASILVSWLLVALLTAMALLIAVLIFQNTPPQQPPPPVPTEASASASQDPADSSSSPSEQSSASPNESQSETASPPPETPDGFDSPSKDPSMMSAEPTGGESEGGQPSSPNRKL